MRLIRVWVVCVFAVVIFSGCRVVITPKNQTSSQTIPAKVASGILTQPESTQNESIDDMPKEVKRVSSGTNTQLQTQEVAEILDSIEQLLDEEMRLAQ